jgi:hypothetical protein
VAEPTVTFGPVLPSDTLTLEVGQQMPTPFWIPIKVAFHDNLTKLVQVKAWGGLSGGPWVQNVEHGSCSSYVTGSNLGSEIGPVGLYECRLYLRPETSKEGTQSGSVSLSYALTTNDIPKWGCSSSGETRTVTLTAVIKKPPQPAATQEAPIEIPDVKMVLGQLSHNPTTVGVESWTKTFCQVWKEGGFPYAFASKFDIWTSMSVAPSADAKDFILNPAEDGFAAEGIGIAGQMPAERTYHPTGVGLAFRFKPTTAKFYHMKMILTWRTCLKHQLNKCGPTQSFTLPFQADSRPPGLQKTLDRDAVKKAPPIKTIPPIRTIPPIKPKP